MDIRLIEADVRTCVEQLRKAGVGGEGAFDLVVDKSTTDALLCDTENGMRTVETAAAQVAQLVRRRRLFSLAFRTMRIQNVFAPFTLCNIALESRILRNG
jgi:hypothetical protein|eukprot:COSAG02_NODE_470_length_21686_cov_5.095937_11_plen_100_part_00